MKPLQGKNYHVNDQSSMHPLCIAPSANAKECVVHLPNSLHPLLTPKRLRHIHNQPTMSEFQETGTTEQ